MTQAAFSTADLFDAQPDTVQVCELQFRSFGKHSCFAGPCVTLTTFEDHRPVLEVLKTQGEGRVLVVDGQGSLKVGLLGDRLAEIAVQTGWAGVVINGAVRDSSGIDALGIGVKALGTTARRGAVEASSTTGEPLSIGGATVTAGDWIYADRDCVIVAPHKLDIP